jgi:hypothetical protein
MLPLLTKLFNQCVSLSCIPQAWRSSIVTILYKGKGDKSDINNYRGIMLGNSLYKLLDKLILNRVLLHTSHLIPAEQFGFVPGRSSAQAIHRLYEKVYSEVYQQNNKYYVAFLDYAKAFDSVNRTKLFQKLVNFDVLPKQLLNMIAVTMDVNY